MCDPTEWLVYSIKTNFLLVTRVHKIWTRKDSIYFLRLRKRYVNEQDFQFQDISPYLNKDSLV